MREKIIFSIQEKRNISGDPRPNDLERERQKRNQNKWLLWSLKVFSR